jgi:hypothetical protein
LKLTKKNIEDWDFRRLERGSDADVFMSANYRDVLFVAGLRTFWIEGLVEKGLARLSADCEYIVPVSDGEFYRAHHGVLESATGTFEMRPDIHFDNRFALFHATTRPPFHGWLTHSGRVERRVLRSLWREWTKDGRIKVHLLPTEQELNQEH